ncbi:MAG: DUF3011 domain-containing protein [Gloeomargarita sp. GMQP_bins_120]
MAAQAQDRWVPGGETRRMTCESINGRYRTCPVGNHGGVRLERQLSNRRCIEGRTWGYDRQGIWVDQGCEGEFLIWR